MKRFYDIFKSLKIYYGRILLLSLLLGGCATKKLQVQKKSVSYHPTELEPTHTFFLAGGLGTSVSERDKMTFNLLKEELQKAETNSTMIFTGDNIGPGADNENYDHRLLDIQLDLIKNFKGQTYFMEGDNEWKSMDTDKMDKIHDYIKKEKDVSAEGECALDRIHVNDNLDLILVNSSWFTSDWNQVRGINRRCDDIVTHRRFMEQLGNYINDAQDRNVVIAMHNPVFGNGKYSGQYALDSQLLPLPVVGSLITGAESLGGFSPKYTSSRGYNAFRIIMSFLAQESDRITFVSGHERSLQYLKGKNGTPQIISGALGEVKATKRSKGSISTFGGSLEYEGKFTYGQNGFARLDYFLDGSSKVTFITGKDSTELEVLEPFPVHDSPSGLSSSEADSIVTGIITDETRVNKSGFYKFFWGDRYRKVFVKKVRVPVAELDTLYGGLALTKRGGGHQSYVLRLEDGQERQYAMRSLDKNALRILKYNLLGAAYQLKEFQDTATEDIIYDFFTTSNPFMLDPLNTLAEAAQVNSATARLYYVPKQPVLGKYNKVYGNGLYYIEERPSEEWAQNPGYNRSLPDVPGKIIKFESTFDMMEKLREDESYSVDERSFVRARLFDMLIGDWDRHADQYRWAEYDAGKGDKRFVAIPRDRDNAFPKFDGIGMPILKWFVPLIRPWQSYGPKIKSFKWLNDKGNILDQVLVTKNGTELWVEEAKFLQRNISDADIEKAFGTLPKEVRDETAATIKANFRQRLADLSIYAQQYGDYLNKRTVLHATDKDDIVRIERLSNGKTRVNIRRNLTDRTNELFFERTFDAEKTKEIWIYGLNDTDKFIVEGEGDHEIFIRLIGGYGKDEFAVTNTKAIKVYDHRYEEIVFEDRKPKKQLTDLYETNLFHWRQLQENYNTFVPDLGYRVDDGFFLGGTDTYTVNGFNGNPFRQQHTLSANFYPSFSALELDYKSVWANIFPKINFELEGYYTNDRYVNNFFGIGNETINLEDNLDIDYYRARIEKLKLSTGLAFHTLKVSLNYERYQVREQSDRLFTPQNLDSDVFDGQNYLGGEVSLYYKNEDSKSFPTRYFYAGLKGGYKANTELWDNKFGYATAKIGMARKLIPSGNLVLSSTLEGSTNFGNDYFFYHAPSLGGNNGLRGFRDERFAGKSYFYQSSDLRVRLKRFPTAIVPITLGVFGGFDYGRVWSDSDSSNVWHTSQGGGLWLGGLNEFGLSLGYFNSVEGNYFQASFVLGF